MQKDTRYIFFVAGLIAFIVLLLVALAMGVLLAGSDSTTTPIVTAIIGIVAAVIPSLLALLRVEHVHKAIEEQNGHIAQLEQTAQTVQQTSAEAAAAMRDLTQGNEGKA